MVTWVLAAMPHTARPSWRGTIGAPHLHKGLQETLCQGTKGTPILWLLMLGF